MNPFAKESEFEAAVIHELISKHAVQLAKLKQLKSACLERMFV